MRKAPRLELVLHPCPACGTTLRKASTGSLACPACDAASSTALEAGPAGRPRNFLAWLLWGILTLGIAFYIYQFLVFREVDRQEGRRHHIELFVLSVAGSLYAAISSYGALTSFSSFELFAAAAFQTVGAVLLAAYLFLETLHLRKARLATALSPGLPAWLLPLVVLGGLGLPFVEAKALLVGLSMFWLLFAVGSFANLQNDLNEYWQALGPDARPPIWKGQPAQPVQSANPDGG